MKPLSLTHEPTVTGTEPDSPVCSAVDPARCPLCGGPNDCRLCTHDAYKGSCWCAGETVPETLLARVPEEARDKACICRACIHRFHRETRADGSPPLRPGDFYFNPDGLLVFTEAYHRRRGYCCEHGCRHCPWANSPRGPNPLTAGPVA